MTEEVQTAEEPERMAPPGTERRSRPTRASNEDEVEAANERTSPFPYAENFDDWVADETADPKGRQRPREMRDGNE